MRLSLLCLVLMLASMACASKVAGAGVDDQPDARASSSENLCQDTSSDPMNCGVCDRVCVIPNATAGCEQGECTVAACPAGYTDDDGDIGNGCELPAGEEGGPLTCREDKSELCNAFDDNCDGQCDEGRAASCRQGVHRGQGGGHHIYSPVLSDVQTAPYAIEAQNFFYTYAAPGVGLVEAYLCTKADNTHFITTSAACENAGTIVRSVGFWSVEPACDAVPLYRLYRGASNNHFYTTSAAERDNASTNLGYVYEFVAGYVFPAK